MFRCDACGERFEEPLLCTMQENLDGEHGWETRVVAVCPWCGEGWFKEVEEL